jgi:hypothetical protein
MEGEDSEDHGSVADQTSRRTSVEDGRVPDLHDIYNWIDLFEKV